MAGSELIEDYCIRASRVHPWALEAGTRIKSLKSENATLRLRLEAAERERDALKQYGEKVLAELRTENARLAGKLRNAQELCVEELQAGVMAAEERDRLADEVERLREQLQELLRFLECACQHWACFEPTSSAPRELYREAAERAAGEKT